MLAVALVLDRIGYIGVSNDDASRTLIAWNTAHHPSLDPTRSSWLPVHTWELAASLAITRDLSVTPRALSLLGALAATWIAVQIARKLGASSTRAIGAGLVALSAPWSVFTAWTSGVPEMPCVAWTLAAAWCLMPSATDTRPGALRALCGGACITIACGHRYEAWFAGLGMLAVMTVRDRRRPGPVVLAWLAAGLFPIAWLAINQHRAGDPFDFVHRVVSYGQTAGASHAPFAAVGDLVISSGLAIAAGLVGARAVRGRSGVLVAGAVAVVVGVVAGGLRGGGATHHAARTLLLATWLLAPLVPFAVKDPRGWAPVLGIVFVQHAIGWRALPRDVSRDAVFAGRVAASVTPSGRCYAIETGRLDFLWVEVASGRPDDARPDRVYGAPSPAPARWLEVANACPVAIAHTPESRNALTAAGWATRGAAGGWFVLAR